MPASTDPVLAPSGAPVDPEHWQFMRNTGLHFLYYAHMRAVPLVWSDVSCTRLEVHDDKFSMNDERKLLLRAYIALRRHYGYERHGP